MPGLINIPCQQCAKNSHPSLDFHVPLRFSYSPLDFHEPLNIFIYPFTHSYTTFKNIHLAQLEYGLSEEWNCNHQIGL